MSRASLAAWISLSVGGLAAVPAHAQDGAPAESTLPPAPYAGRVLNWPGKTHPGAAPPRSPAPAAHAAPLPPALPAPAAPAFSAAGPVAQTWSPGAAAVTSIPRRAAESESRYGPARAPAAATQQAWSAPAAPEWRPPRLAPPAPAPAPERLSALPPPREPPVAHAPAPPTSVAAAKREAAPDTSGRRDWTAEPSAQPRSLARAAPQPVEIRPAPARQASIADESAGRSVAKPLAPSPAANPVPAAAASRQAAITADGSTRIPSVRTPATAALGARAPGSAQAPPPAQLATREPARSPVPGPKASAPTPQPPPTQQASATPSASEAPVRTLAPPRHPWSERYGVAASAPVAVDPVARVKSAKAAKSTKIASPARPQQTAQAAAAAAPSAGASVRFYSVHRDFGIAPSPAPIPPQFFGPAQDLSEPEGPQSIPAQTTGKGALAARARAEADTTAPD